MSAVPSLRGQITTTVYEIDTPDRESGTKDATPPSSGGVPADKVAAQREEALIVHAKVDSQILELAKKDYDAAHRACEKTELMAAIISRSKFPKPEVELQHYVDLKHLYDAMAERMTKLAESDDPAVQQVLAFTHDVDGKAFSYKQLLRSAQLQDDVDSRAKHFGLDASKFEPSDVAKEFAAKLASCEPFSFFSYAFVVSFATVFGGQIIRGRTLQKYDNKVSAEYYNFEDYVPSGTGTRQSMKIAGSIRDQWKLNFFRAYPEQHVAFYSTGTKAYQLFEALLKAEWAGK